MHHRRSFEYAVFLPGSADISDSNVQTSRLYALYSTQNYAEHAQRNFRTEPQSTVPKSCPGTHTALQVQARGHTRGLSGLFRIMRTSTLTRGPLLLLYQGRFSNVDSKSLSRRPGSPLLETQINDPAGLTQHCYPSSKYSIQELLESV